MVTQLTAAMKRCFSAPSIFQNMMFCNVNALVLQLLLTLPVGSCTCEAVELSFSCLRRVKTWSKGGRALCRKGTTFTVLCTNQTLSLCLLCFATLAAMTAVCEIFNLLHLRSMAQGGAWPKWPNGKYANERSLEQQETIVVVELCDCNPTYKKFVFKNVKFHHIKKFCKVPQLLPSPLYSSYGTTMTRGRARTNPYR